MKRGEAHQIQVDTAYGYLLWRNRCLDFASRSLPSRVLVQAALKQGQRYSQKRRVWLPDPILADIDREYVEAAVEARRLGRRRPT